ncbi:MAG: hypothetical protein MZV70_41305 [Desulfobacterales bacterium]|nr:hypothetical protein [Desulfobacterales bacterium]
MPTWTAKGGRSRHSLAAAETNLSTMEQRRAGSLLQRDNLVEQRRNLFGERDPDDEERRLAAALSGAATRREEAAAEAECPAE